MLAIFFILDIFPFYEKDGVMTKDTWFKTHRQDTEFPVRFLQPLGRLSKSNEASNFFIPIFSIVELQRFLGIHRFNSYLFC